MSTAPRMARLRVALTLPYVLLAVLACGTLVGNPGEGGGDGSDGKSDPAPAAVATPVPVVFALTDAPIDDAQSVFVTVEGLAIAAGPESDGSGEGANSTVWVDVPLKVTGELDVLKYQDGDTVELAEAPALAPGAYARTRLTLAASPPPRLVDFDGTEHVLDLSGLPNRMIEVRVPFVAASSSDASVGPTRVTLDFDLRRSLKATVSATGSASYALNPTFRLVEAQRTGKLVGTAVGARSVCVFAAAQGDKDADDDCAHAVTSTRVKDGRYTVAFLPAGSYVVRAYRNGDQPLDSAAVEVRAGAATTVAPLTASTAAAASDNSGSSNANGGSGKGDGTKHSTEVHGQGSK